LPKTFSTVVKEPGNLPILTVSWMFGDNDPADVGSSSESDGSGVGYVLWGILSRNVKALSGQNRFEIGALGKEQEQTP